MHTTRNALLLVLDYFLHVLSDEHKPSSLVLSEVAECAYWYNNDVRCILGDGH